MEMVTSSFKGSIVVTGSLNEPLFNLLWSPNFGKRFGSKKESIPDLSIGIYKKLTGYVYTMST